MRLGVPTCSRPDHADKLYFRCMFHEFFYGPFDDESAVIEAIRRLDEADPYWDYDAFAIHYGDPNSTDWVTGLPFVPDEMRQRIEAARKVP